MPNETKLNIAAYNYGLDNQHVKKIEEMVNKNVRKVDNVEYREIDAELGRLKSVSYGSKE